MSDYVRVRCASCLRETTFTCEVPATVVCQGCGSSRFVAVDNIQAMCNVCGKKGIFNIPNSEHFSFIHNAPNCKSMTWVLTPMLEVFEKGADTPVTHPATPVPEVKKEERVKQLQEKKLEIEDILQILAPLHKRTKRDVIADALQNLRAMGIPIMPKVRNLKTITKETLWSVAADLQKQFTAIRVE